MSNETMLPQIIFGDNQFFGVNHMSEDKARAQAMRFRETSEIIRVLQDAYDAGIRAFMCTTHDRIGEIADHFRRNADKYPDFAFYPCMPYAHKYANAVTEVGMIEAVRRFLPAEGGFSALLRSGLSLAGKDVSGVTKLLIDAEMKMFEGCRTPIIFLQNVVTDLLLGLGANEAFSIFAEHVREKYNAEPGFITMNTPMLLPVLRSLGIQNPIVCSNINAIGFRMSGGRELYEETLKKETFRPIAMSVLASGALKPKEAISYIAELGTVESIVFGASSRTNIDQTTQAIREAYAERHKR